MLTKRWGVTLLAAGALVLLGGYFLSVFSHWTFIPFLAVGLGWVVAGATTIRRAQRVRDSSR